MRLDEARARIAERAELNAFISISEETGSGTVIAVKDLVDVKGLPTTAGGIILPRTPAADDAPVIKRIRAAGCVVVGKANLHEFAYGVTSVNPHYGTVRNPHDPTRVAGGSSGGSAVAVATGMCDWAVGSDTGGSIRIPGSLCGVAGFKPAFGSIDVAGVVPLSKSLDTLGAMAPDIAKTAAAYAAMSGEEVSLDGLTRPRLAMPEGWVTDLDEPTTGAWADVARDLPAVEHVGLWGWLAIATGVVWILAAVGLWALQPWSCLSRVRASWSGFCTRMQPWLSARTVLANRDFCVVSCM